jgi:hypothetical protein
MGSDEEEWAAKGLSFHGWDGSTDNANSSGRRCTTVVVSSGQSISDGVVAAASDVGGVVADARVIG